MKNSLYRIAGVFISDTSDTSDNQDNEYAFGIQDPDSFVNTLQGEDRVFFEGLDKDDRQILFKTIGSKKPKRQVSQASYSNPAEIKSNGLQLERKKVNSGRR